MCAPVSVTAAGVISTGCAAMAGYIVALVALSGILLVNYRNSLKKLFSKE